MYGTSLCHGYVKQQINSLKVMNQRDQGDETDVLRDHSYFNPNHLNTRQGVDSNLFNVFHRRWKDEIHLKPVISRDLLKRHS